MPENNLQIDAAERIERYSKFQIQWHLKFWRIKGILICTQSLNDLPFGVLHLSDQVCGQRFTLRRGDISLRDSDTVRWRSCRRPQILGPICDLFVNGHFTHGVLGPIARTIFSRHFTDIFLSNFNKACSRHQIDALNSYDWVH